MYKSKIYYWFFVAFCQILGKSILTMLWPYALLQRWGGCAEKRELVVFQPNYISCATKTKIAIDEQDNGEEMWNRERDRSENDRVFLMHMCALIHDVTFLYAGIAQWGFLLSVLSVIMPRLLSFRLIAPRKKISTDTCRTWRHWQPNYKDILNTLGNTVCRRRQLSGSF